MFANPVRVRGARWSDNKTRGRKVATSTTLGLRDVELDLKYLKGRNWHRGAGRGLRRAPAAALRCRACIATLGCRATTLHQTYDYVRCLHVVPRIHCTLDPRT